MKCVFSIALWVCLQAVLMPLCLCHGGICPADLPGKTACCHSTEAEGEFGESRSAPCPRCDGAEIDPHPMGAKPVIVPTAHGEDLPSLESTTEASFAAGLRALELKPISGSRALFLWWQTHRTRLAVFRI